MINLHILMNAIIIFLTILNIEIINLLEKLIIPFIILIGVIINNIIKNCIIFKGNNKIYLIKFIILFVDCAL